MAFGAEQGVKQAVPLGAPLVAQMPIRSKMRDMGANGKSNQDNRISETKQPKVWAVYIVLLNY
jgi:hypothetical protein